MPAAYNVTKRPDWFKQSLYRAQRYTNVAADPRREQFSTTADLDPSTVQGLDMAKQAAMGGIPGMQGAMQQMGDVASGNFLYGGPGFDRAVEAATRYTLPNVRGQFATAGRNGGLAQAAVANAIADPYAAQYGQERQLQQQAAGMLPNMFLGSLAPAQTMMDVGDRFRSQQIEQQMDQMNRQVLASQVYANLNPAIPTTQVQTMPGQGGSGFGKALGLAGTLAGFALGGPAGASIGGSLGGMLGGGASGGSMFGGSAGSMGMSGMGIGQMAPVGGGGGGSFLSGMFGPRY